MFSLFNAADDCLANYVDDEAFDHNLLMNVLFQDSVLVDEALVFNSRRLASHVQKALHNHEI